MIHVTCTPEITSKFMRLMKSCLIEKKWCGFKAGKI